MHKKKHQRSHRRGKKVCFFTAQLSLSFSGGKGVGRPERLFYFPTFLFPIRFSPLCGVLDRVRSLSLKHGVGFFLLPTFVYSCFCVLTAGGPAAALNFDSVGVELNFSRLNWIFPEWIELFPSLAYSKRIQINNQEANKERKGDEQKRKKEAGFLWILKTEREKIAANAADVREANGLISGRWKEKKK